jgi:T-complex protein 1 subunit theta
MDTRVLSGMVFGRQPEGVISKAKDAKVAVFTCGLDVATTETKGTVLIKNAKEMMDFTLGEETQLENVWKRGLIRNS